MRYVLLVLVLVMVCCDVKTTPMKNQSRFKIETFTNDTCNSCAVITDTKTGNEYLVVDGRAIIRLTDGNQK